MQDKPDKSVKTVGIVAEYNPFHNGHAYQINQIKNIIPDCVIISVMSGNLVQRGDFALFSKYERAKTAILNGVDAVFELPPIYSCAPANIFAFAAVYIMHALQRVNYICFGSECGDLELLDFAAEKTESEEFNIKLREYINSNKNSSYPQSVLQTFKDLYGEKKSMVFSGSNNILGVEYLRAVKKLNSPIESMTIKRTEMTERTGGNYNLSASYIRTLLRDNKNIAKLINFMPENSYDAAASLMKSGKFADINNISSAIISHINRTETKEIAKYAEVDGGEEYRIKKAAENAFDYYSLLRSLGAKHNTSSATRRTILNIFFEITRREQKNPPDFTNLLAANQAGRQFLNSIRKSSQIKVIAKPAEYKNYDNCKNLFIDNTYKLALVNRNGEINAIKEKPYILQ